MSGSVNKVMHPVSRFMALVDPATIKKDQCWQWAGASKGNGYGNFVLHGQNKPAHRASYEMFVGPVKSGLDVCHQCDNRGCVNPDHLFLGTRLDNMADCKRKGRTARGAKLGDRRGENSPSARLCWDNVREIRGSPEPAKVIAARFGVTSDNINRIRRNDTWRV